MAIFVDENEGYGTNKSIGVREAFLMLLL